MDYRDDINKWLNKYEQGLNNNDLCMARSILTKWIDNNARNQGQAKKPVTSRSNQPARSQKA